MAVPEILKSVPGQKALLDILLASDSHRLLLAAWCLNMTAQTFENVSEFLNALEPDTSAEFFEEVARFEYVLKEGG